MSIENATISAKRMYEESEIPYCLVNMCANSARRIVAISPEDGEGMLILHKVLDGLYVTYTDYRQKGIDFGNTLIEYKDIIVMTHYISGNSYFTLENQKALAIRPGDIVIFGGTINFTNSVVNTERCKSVGLYCEYDVLLSSLKKLGIDTAELEKYWLFSSHNNEILANSDNIEFKAAAKKLAEYALSDNRFMLLPTALELLYCGIAGFRKTAVIKKPKPSAYYVEIVSQVKHFIDSDPVHCMSIEQLCFRFGLSQTYFRRIFKDCYGVSPYHYILHKRLDRSKELLTDSDMKIYEIAFSLGFASSSKFAEIFKKTFGFLPSEFRRDMLKE